MKSPFAKGFLGLFVILFFAAGYVFWRVKNPPVVGEKFSALTKEQKTQRRQDAKKLEDQVADVYDKIKDGDRAPFQIIATEQQLNTLLQDRIRTEKFVVKNLRTGLDSQKLSLQGDVPYKGLETTFTLVGNISAQNGKVLFKTESLLIGGLMEAPKSWKRKIETQVTNQLNKLLEKINVDVTKVSIEEKRLVIEGTPR